MKQKTDGLKLENQMCFPLYVAAKEVVKSYHPYLTPLGLTYTQYIVLMVLWEEKRISVKGLGDKLYLDSGTLTPLLKSLEKKGLITRNRSKIDERYLIVEVTPEGELLREKAEEIPVKMAETMPISDVEAEELHRLLYKIIQAERA